MVFDIIIDLFHNQLWQQIYLMFFYSGSLMVIRKGGLP